MTNTNMRKGFTMIELIFVIVIIGILAAVAIPKLSATRDDAKISSIIANARTIGQDVKNFYTAQGETKFIAANVSDITDVPLFSDVTCGTQVTTSVFAGSTAYICDDAKDVLIISSTNTAPITLTMKQGTSTSTIATVLTTDKVFQALTDGTAGKTTKLGGQQVTR